MAGITGSTKQEEDLRSRMPDPLWCFPEMAGVAEGLHKAIRNGAIPQHQAAAEDDSHSWLVPHSWRGCSPSASEPTPPGGSAADGPSTNRADSRSRRDLERIRPRFHFTANHAALLILVEGC
ncbi:hypothetical protein [Nonomuraea sp. NEAU-A123]|uniref:hypothetical protein n=1 Tax=Nonomuraea sp. NEAU-A123 TaxID=2839649 RepID=UPI001BE3ED47|nr:hypothetical protein [Nonomuraea sp. NEAU-A123]MBT2225896.1 hypothetical protein [Nonomuraea sp. NEAU-A123]